MSDPERSTMANDETLSRLIAQARHRVVLRAPAIGIKVAKALVDRWQTLRPEDVTVILDMDPEVYRLGYDEPETLIVVEEVARGLGRAVNGVPGCSVKTLLDAIDQWTKHREGGQAMRTWRLSTLAAGLTVVMTGPGFSADTVRVFRYDGGLQCGMRQAVPLNEMAKELTAVNITVLSSEKRVVPGFIIVRCGAPTGIANVYEIARDDLARIPADQQGVKRFQSWMDDGPAIEVAKYDGGLQCDMGRPVSLDEMAKELRAANIAIEAHAKKADGIQHPRMCGASTGMMNVYRIRGSDLEKARALGFVLHIEVPALLQILGATTDLREADRTAETLAELDPVALVLIIAKIDDPGRRAALDVVRHLPSQHPKAIGVLRRSAPSVLPALTEWLGHRDLPVTTTYSIYSDLPGAAISLLGTMQTPEAVRLLIQASRDTDGFVRSEAIHALGESGPAAAEAVPELRLRLRDLTPRSSPRDPRVRIFDAPIAAEVLARIGPAGILVLREALSDSDREVRRVARVAMEVQAHQLSARTWYALGWAAVGGYRPAPPDRQLRFIVIHIACAGLGWLIVLASRHDAARLVRYGSGIVIGTAISWGLLEAADRLLPPVRWLTEFPFGNYGNDLEWGFVPGALVGGTALGLANSGRGALRRTLLRGLAGALLTVFLGLTAVAWVDKLPISSYGGPGYLLAIVAMWLVPGTYAAMAAAGLGLFIGRAIALRENVPILGIFRHRPDWPFLGKVVGGLLVVTAGIGVVAIAVVPSARMAAIEILPDSMKVRVLVWTLANSRAAMRADAAGTLGSMGPAATGVLAALEARLGDAGYISDPRGRRYSVGEAAAAAIVRIDPLYARRHPNWVVRVAAVNHLFFQTLEAQIPHEVAVPALLEYIRTDPDSRVRSKAWSYLYSIAPQAASEIRPE